MRMGATTTRQADHSCRLLRLLLWAIACLALFTASPARAQGLPTASLLTFAHTQQTAGATESETRSIAVPPGVGGPFYLVVSARNPLDRNRISALTVSINGNDVFGAADLFRNFAIGGKKVDLQASNTLALSMAAAAGVIVDLRVLGTPVPIKPIDLGPTPVSVQRGATVTLKATLSPTPTVAGAMVVVSSRPLVALPTVLLVPYTIGQTSIVIPVRGVSAGDAVVTVGGIGGSATANVKVVTTGAAVSSLQPATLSIERGASSTLTVRLNSVRSSATTVALATAPAGIVTVPGSVSVPAGALSASVNVGTLAEGTAQVAATLGTSRATSSVTVTPSASASVVSLLPPTSSAILGAVVPLTVTISSAQTTPTTLALSAEPSGVVTLPSSVVIAAGQTSTSFSVGTSALGNALVRATLNATTAEAAISVVAPLPTLASLQPSTLDLITGASGSFTLALDAAQPNDTVVPLSVSNAAVLQAPASVTVPAGRASATFSVSGLTAGTAQLIASLNGTTRSAGVVVAAPPAAVAAVEPASFGLQLGATGSATVRLNAVQAQDVNVTLAATPAGVLQVPLNLIVPAGSQTAPVPITGLAQGVAILTATLPGGAASTTVTVTPPPVLITGLTPAELVLAKGRTGTLRLTVSPAPGAPIVVALTASSTSVGVPAQITIPAGALGVDIPVLATSEGSAVVGAGLNGSSATSGVQVTPPEVQLLELSPLDATAFVGDTLQYNAGVTLTDGTTRDDTTRASWVSSNPAVGVINSSGVAQALAPGNTTISASSGGVTRTTPLSVLATPTLALTPPAAGLKVGETTAYTVTSSAAADSGGLVITLESSGTGTLTAPATVTIAAGQTSATFGVTATGAGNVVLTARAPRRTAGTASITIGSAVVITGVTPASGPVGATVTINGSGFDATAANDRVVFTGSTSAGAVTTVLSASPTQLLVSVPAGAQSGPISVTTPLGTAVSPDFTVQGEQDFGIAASPAESVLIAGTSTTLAVQPSSTGTKPFTGLLDIAVLNLPAGVTARLQPATLNTSRSGAIVFTASAGAAPGRYELLVQASGLTSAGRQSKNATVVLNVQSATGATGVKGRFVTPDGRPIAGVLVRVDALQTATDAAGNFLLTGLPAGPVTLRFDATPAHPLYPIWPYSVTLTSGQIVVIADWTINPPPADETFVPIANAGAAQKVTDARFPGLEITLPAGVSIIGWDGVPKSRIAVERIPVDKLPVPLPPVPIKESYQLYFGTPMGGIPSQPIPVTLPNVAEAEPGEKSEIWYFDGSPMGGSGEWKLAGLGTISADGKTVVSDPGVGIPRFCGVCGLLSQSCPPPPKPPQPPPTCPAASSPNPIDYYTGQEMPTSAGLTCQGLVPIDTGMSYNPVDAFNGRAGTFGSVGLGWTLDYDVALLPFTGPQKRVVMPGGRFHDFVDDGSGTYRSSNSSMFDGALMRRYPAGGPEDWEVVFKTGRIWRFKPFPGITGVIRGGPPLFMTEMIDPAGATLSITRRNDGRLLAAGTQHRAVTASYGSNGFIAEIKDPENRTTRFTYTPTNRIATVTDAVGGVTRYTYVDDTEITADAVCGAQPTFGERIKTISHPGRPNPTENFYGVGRRVLRQIGYDGIETRFAYKLAGACVTNIATPGVRCTGANCPDTDSWENQQAGWRVHGGQVIGTTVTRADGSTDTVRYGAAGAMLERQDGNAQAMSYVRDSQGRVTRRTDALGRTTRSTYDAQGNVIRSIDALGRITDTTYDSRWGKPTSITRYDVDGSPVTTLTAYGPTTGKLVRSTNPLGQSTTYEYSALGQLAAVTDALGNRSEMSYSAAGDLIVALDPLGNDSRLAYDQVGRATLSTDPLGYSAATQYNGLDQPTQGTDPLGGVTRYAYDAANRLTSVTNALNKAIESYGYDTGDRLTSRTDALGRSEGMSYDVLGRLATRTDRNGQVSRFSYDSEGRITRVQRADGTLSMAYDAIGRVLRIEDTAGGGSTLSYDYDNADRLVREVQTTASGSNVVAYEYDTLDRRTRRTVNGSDATTYAWDKAGRLTGIGHAGQTTSYAYDAAGRLVTRTLPNGIVQTHGYDGASRLTAITYAQPDTTVIEAITYSYDANGRRIAKASASNSSAQETPFAATYDDADRMTTVTLRGTGAGGADENCTLAYDNNGSLTTKTCGANVTTYGWDAQNRLAAISGPGVTASFSYDALGRRSARTVNGTATTYVYDGMQAVAESKGGIDATLLTGLQIDEVIGRYASTGNRTMIVDALGSVIAEARADRSIATRREYTPYGQVASSGEDSANDSQYTARENDGTGLYFYRARYYDAQLKRFVSGDPIGLRGGINFNAYVDGDPVGKTDPNGEFGLGGAAGAAAFNFGVQFFTNLYLSGGDWRRALKCVDYGDVLISAAVGFAGPSFISNVLGGKAGPAGLTAGQNRYIYFTKSLPIGYFFKKASPPLRPGDDCECKDLTLGNLLGQLTQ